MIRTVKMHVEGQIIRNVTLNVPDNKRDFDCYGKDRCADDCYGLGRINGSCCFNKLGLIEPQIRYWKEFEVTPGTIIPDLDPLPTLSYSG